MIDEHDPAMAQEIFAAFVEHGTWYVPTHLTRWVDAYADDPAVREDSLHRYLHPLMRWQWLEDVNATIFNDPSAEARQTYRDFYYKVADLLLLEADPLQDIRNTQQIRAVVFNGNLYDREALDTIEKHVLKRARSWSVACKILWRFIRNPVSY